MTPSLRWALLLVASLGCVVQALSAACCKELGLDEFMFAHGAWEVSVGSLPYRDFFIPHHPPSLYVFAWPFLTFGDAPTNILWLRGTMVVSLAATVVAAWMVGARHGRAVAWLVPLFVLSTPAVVSRGTEVRADGLAWTLFFLALAVLHREQWRPTIRSGLAGALFGLAVATHQKALVWGLPIPIIVCVDLMRMRGGRSQLLGDVRAFALGGALGLLPLGVWVIATGVGPEMFESAYAWALRQQRFRRPINLLGLKALGGFVAFSWWLLVLGAVALWREVRGGRQWYSQPDFLMAAVLGTTTLYAVSARAPFEYYLIPAATLWAVFGARGAVLLWSGWEGRRRLVLAGVIAALALVAHAYLAVTVGRGNREQLERIATVARLTAPGDCVYDNSGSAVSRPSALWRFFTDAYIRETEGQRLETAIPAAIVEKGCPVFLPDDRNTELPASVKRFLARWYQPYDDEIGVWGRQLAACDTEEKFIAVVDGIYFFHPAREVMDSELRIDGVAVTQSSVELFRGEHAVVRSCPESAEPISLLWLPRDGVPFTPRVR